jgi:HKD family nuclease
MESKTSNNPTEKSPLLQGKEAEELIEHENMHMDSLTSSSTGNFDFNRVIMIALDSSEYSDNAFKWALKNFINPNENDLILLVTVREPIVNITSFGMHIG